MRALIILLVLIASVMLLFGCGEQSDLESRIDDLEAQVLDMQYQIDQLKIALWRIDDLGAKVRDVQYQIDELKIALWRRSRRAN